MFDHKELYSDLIRAMQLETVTMNGVTVYSDSCKDTKDTRQLLPFAAFNKGKRANMALAFASNLVDKYGTKIDRDNYRQAVKSAKIAKQTAERLILAHFDSVRWQDGRFTAFEDMEVFKDKAFQKWNKAILDRHKVILETLETVYFERINK